jgi:hypothetical protein
MKPRLSHALIAAALLVAAKHARAESFFRAEVGLGIQQSRDMGDGTWYQQALPHSEKLRSPAFMIGATGQLWSNGGAWDLRYHTDYVYFGSISASCLCVPDANYNPNTHQTVGTLPRLSPFVGFGHTQGVAATLDLGYTYHGWRFGFEAGPWVYWQTWHESLYNLANEWQNLSHKTIAQVGYVVGARVDRGSFGLSYRYYQVSQRWNPYPGLSTGTHMLMATWRF